MAVKTTAQRAMGAVAMSRVASVWVMRGLRRRVNIVYYHYVGEPAPFYESFDRGMRLARLDKELEELGKRFTFTPLARVIDGTHVSDSDLPALAITFDDGFDLLGNGVADTLEAHGVQATSFLITSCIGNHDLMWRNKLSALRSLSPEQDLVSAYNGVVAPRGLPPVRRADEALAASERWPMAAKDELADAIWAACPVPPLRAFLEEHRPYFDEDGVREWLARGHDIGLHTRTHPHCDRLDEAGIEREIVEPADDLTRGFGLDRLWFSYPFGYRLAPAEEERLAALEVIDCALGIRGCSQRGTPPHRLERASAEDGLGFSLYGLAALGRP